MILSYIFCLGMQVGLPPEGTDLRVSTTQSALHSTSSGCSISQLELLRTTCLQLPRKVCKSLVRLGHLVHVVALGDCFSLSFLCGNDLIGEFDCHRNALLRACGIAHPAKRERKLAFGTNRHRDLIVGTADTT